MNQKEYESKIKELQQHIEVLQKTNLDLVSHNMLLSQQINAYYDVRRRIQMLKELVIRHKELMRHADLRDDAELMAVVRSRQLHIYRGGKKVLVLVNHSQTENTVHSDDKLWESHSKLYYMSFLNTAGLPATNVRGATSLVTTEPAAITAPSPMVTPGKMVE